VADLIDVERNSSSRWAEPEVYHWVLAHPRAVKPIPMRGRLGLWTAELDLADEATAAHREQLEDPQIDRFTARP
jgi:hypothetical protein